MQEKISLLRPRSCNVAELNQVLSSCAKIINHIRGKALNHRLLKSMCESLGTEHTGLLFHTNVRWLSRGRALLRVFELLEEVKVFLKDQIVFDGNLNAPLFVQRLGYLADIFSLLNSLSIPLQEPRLNIVIARGKLNAFVEKNSLWRRRVSSGNRDFPSLEKTSPLCSSGKRSMLLSEVSQHLIMLAKAFEGYSSPGDLHTAKKWILDPFLYNINELPDDDPMKGELIELRADQASQMRHDPKRLEGFWCHNIQSYHQPVKKSSECTFTLFNHISLRVFSAPLSIKTKYRSRLDQETDMRIAISKTEPRIDAIVAQKQEHRSHN